MKHFLQSKTILLGLLVALIPFLEALKGLPLNDTQAQILSAILGILIVVNRFYTNTAINLTAGDK